MLYASNSNSYHSNLSTMDFSKVFIGQYWDEFSLTVCRAKKSKTLFLGLAAGAGIRPLLAMDPSSDIDAVEIDPRSISLCRDIYKKNFSKIQFNIVESCAFEFIGKSKQYDNIWIDIFENDRYSKCMMMQNFWIQVSNRLEPKGTVYVNIYGLPNHLETPRDNSPLNTMLSLLSKVFINIRMVPYRRNVTLILSNHSNHETMAHQVSIKLSKNDETYTKMNCIREQSAITPRIDRSFQAEAWSFSEIDMEMRSRWLLFKEKINRILILKEIPSFKINSLSDFRVLASSAENGRSVLEWLLQRHDPQAIFFPIFIAGEMNHSDINDLWFVDWFFSNWEYLNRAHRSDFTMYFLPQIFAILVNPSKKRLGFMFQFRHIINQLFNAQVE